jgi:hypothetical protein
MSIDSLVSVAPTAVFTVASSSLRAAAATGDLQAEFAQVLAASQPAASVQNLRTPGTVKPEYTSGRLTVGIDSRGQPATVTYHAEDGTRLNSSAFNAADILRNARDHGIDLRDLRGLGEQLDADGVGYRPYELYRGTGSDHGIDFEDLISGGLGTAYDWRQDALAHLKGPYATASLLANQVLASELNLVKRAHVTTGLGIDPGRFRPLASSSEDPRRHIAFNGDVASWHETKELSELQASRSGGRVVSLSPALSVSEPRRGIGTSTEFQGKGVSLVGDTRPLAALPAFRVPVMTDLLLEQLQRSSAGDRDG